MIHWGRILLKLQLVFLIQFVNDVLYPRTSQYYYIQYNNFTKTILNHDLSLVIRTSQKAQSTEPTKTTPVFQTQSDKEFNPLKLFKHLHLFTVELEYSYFLTNNWLAEDKPIRADKLRDAIEEVMLARRRICCHNRQTCFLMSFAVTGVWQP